MIKLEHIKKQYDSGKPNCHTVLEDINLSVEEGEFLAITGKSGAGKSTLLHILGCMDKADAGSYTLFGQDIAMSSDRTLAGLRKQYFGFVMQDFALLRGLSVCDNILVPTYLSKKTQNVRDAKNRVREIAAEVGLENMLTQNVSLLSGGEKQRCAIARALINRPKIVIADEPTGNLDSTNAEAVFSLFQKINRAGTAVILVTHDEELAAACPRRVRLADGRIKESEFE